ncbi:MAG: hypothetical protein IPJ98_23360 [Bryobacterales bacterium]|nr:hypothetical protein [Bryobacterales bacterium]
MTGRERIEARIHHQPVDHLPFMPITMMFAADLAGVRYRDYAADHRVLAEAQLQTAERFGFDYVSVISDPAREASDLGGMVEWYDHQPPAIVESAALLSEKTALAGLRLPAMEAPGRMRDRIEGVRALARAVGSEKIVEGWVEGPCALAADLRGVNTLMLDFLRRRGLRHRAVRICRHHGDRLRRRTGEGRRDAHRRRRCRGLTGGP